MSTTIDTKKRKAEIDATKTKTSKKKNGSLTTMSSKASSAASTTTASETDPDKFKPYTLNEIRDKILELSDRVPQIPDDGINPDNKEQVREWATSMQAVIEEFNLLLCCVSSATYRWGTDRTGAADQHLGLLSSELGNAQDQISSTITPRITNVLAPVVDLVTKQSITTKLEDGIEKKEVSGTSIIAYCLTRTVYTLLHNYLHGKNWNIFISYCIVYCIHTIYRTDCIVLHHP